MGRFYYLLFALALTVLFTASCVTSKGFKETAIIDYSSYYDEGFLITESNSVSFNYKPIGSVFTIVKGNYLVEKEYGRNYSRSSSVIDIRSNKQPRQKNSRNNWNSYTTQNYNIYDALDEVVRESKLKGADGIINIKIQFTYDKNYGDGYEITGMAIKRLP